MFADACMLGVRVCSSPVPVTGAGSIHLALWLAVGAMLIATGAALIARCLIHHRENHLNAHHS